MPTLSRAHAQEILAPYHMIVWEIVQESWAEWRSVQDFRASIGLAPVIYHRTIANYVFDAIARRATLRFGAIPTVHVEIESQTIKIVFKGSLVSRFKKGGDDKLGRNVPTQAAMAFAYADGVLAGMPAYTSKVEFVWIPNDIWTQVEQVLVVARDGDDLIWEYDIRPAADSAKILPFSPRQPESPTSVDADDLVKPKGAPSKKTSDE